MAWLNQTDEFQTHWYRSPVLGIAAKMGQHDSGFHKHEMGQLLYTTRMYTNFTGKSFVFTSSGRVA